ncbi:MAG: transporter associated domain-containing protein [Anaerococcus hydrogenalis]|uniref:transporter associated domain-containing protein n=1 Tax=Anaerococcus hydrogenalis TaxID=33029 RepID=UPI0028FE5E94|nr:transporter associated domain-containing protein [Anaerococcus hydrogenalis]MDU2582347.1 transporter associated domain-containing protein [Anaerococcus hydrogenalis]
MGKKLKEKIDVGIKVLEIVICISILFSLILSVPNLVRYALTIIKTPNLKQNYELLNEFLKHALLIVVGIELIEMILTKSHEAILTLILFVIARKMLLYSVDLIDILIGSISIGLIFAIIKFVVKDDKLMAKIDNTYSASVPVKKIKEEYKLNIPQNMSNTLGGLVYEIAKIEGIEEIKENTRLIYGTYKFKVISMKDGVIQRIRIEEMK